MYTEVIYADRKFNKCNIKETMFNLLEEVDTRCNVRFRYNLSRIKEQQW